MNKEYSRRRFIKSTLTAGVAIAGSHLAFSAGKNVNQYDPKGLPTAVLGKTGVVIPRIAMGLGSRFLNIKTLDEAIEMCNYALDNGLYYWDTARKKFSSQQKLLPVTLKKRNWKLKIV